MLFGKFMLDGDVAGFGFVYLKWCRKFYWMPVKMAVKPKPLFQNFAAGHDTHGASPSTSQGVPSMAMDVKA